MRTKKATINILVSVITFIVGFLPIILVRKVFLDKLGPELLGLSSLFTNIIGYLSIVEMGIGTAIIFSLYKPFAENDTAKITAYLNYYKKLYKVIGIVVLLLGLFLLPFLNIFITDPINMGEARIYFVLFLINTVMGYYFSYKFCILNVAQEGYKITIATTVSKLIIAVLQVVFLFIVPDFYIYLIIQISVNLIYFILLNLYIDSKNRWLTNASEDALSRDEKRSLSKNIKALMYHKIGGVVIFSTDNLVISSFINLATVAKYNNYSLIISAMQGIISTAMSAITASIGNLLVEKSKDEAYVVHKRLFFINFWVVSLIAIVLFNTLTPFVTLWLGENQTIDQFTLSIILLNLYIQLMRGSVEKFNEGGGNYYQDRFAPVFECIIKLSASIALVKLLGLSGVFLGTLISNLSVVFWVKPKITYKYIFKTKLVKYFGMYFKYLAIGIVPFIICYFVSSRLVIGNGSFAFVITCILNLMIINIFYLIIFWRNKEFIYLKNLLIKAWTSRRANRRSFQKGSEFLQ